MSSSPHRSAFAVAMYHCLRVSTLEMLSDMFPTYAGEEMGNLINLMAAILDPMA
jgi:hypothetical protein